MTTSGERLLDARRERLERRVRVRPDGRVLLVPPTRRAGLGACVASPLLVGVMLIAGDLPVGRFPLAERLFAVTVALTVLPLAVGTLLLPLGARRPRVRRTALRLLGTALAAGLTLAVVLSTGRFLPLHLDGLVAG